MRQTFHVFLPPIRIKWRPIFSKGTTMADWGIEKARSIYNVAVWSEGYFDVNKNDIVEHINNQL